MRDKMMDKKRADMKGRMPMGKPASIRGDEMGMEDEEMPSKKRRTQPVMPPKSKLKGGGMASSCGSKKKGYAKGGKVRGAGCATKGTRPCKMM